MAKLTKVQTKLHEQAMGLVRSNERLTFDDRFFILKNYNPMATNNVTSTGAFFTPLELAREFDIFARPEGSLVDLCAGIGTLAFSIYYYSLMSGGSRRGWLTQDIERITCVELNPEYVEVGKRVLPEANWVEGSVLDERLISDIGTFDAAISNPPFGNIQGEADWLNYQGSQFQLKVIEIANRIAGAGTFIIPPGFSNYDVKKHEHGLSQVMCGYKQLTGIELSPLPLDTECHEKDWMGAAPKVELVAIRE